MTLFAITIEFAGAIAQLGERYNGIVEVGGSIPPGSTSEIDSHLRLYGWVRILIPTSNRITWVRIQGW